MEGVEWRGEGVEGWRGGGVEGDSPAAGASGERTWSMSPPSSPPAPGPQGMSHTSHSENEPKPTSEVWCVGTRNSVPYHSVRCQSCLPPCLLRQHPALIVQQKLRHKHTHTPAQTPAQTPASTQPFVIVRSHVHANPKRLSHAPRTCGRGCK
jgi:hypothetical protein